MANEATGWAVVNDGILDVRTVADIKPDAARYALRLAGIEVQCNCDDRECDCPTLALARFRPSDQLVRVRVEAYEED